MNEEAIAKVMLRDCENWTAQGRKEIADWLRDQAEALERDGEKYGPWFEARRWYPKQA